MMICNADFEDLFPDLFQPEPAPRTQQADKAPSAAAAPANATYAAIRTMFSAYDEMTTRRDIRF